MAPERPFPPSARRRALARAAGLHAASPVLVGALACAAALIATLALGRSAVARLGAWLRAACEGTARWPGLAGSTRDAAIPPDASARHAFDASSIEHASTGTARDSLEAIAHGDPGGGAVRDGGAASATSIGDASTDAGAFDLHGLPAAVLELVLPVLAATALAAVIATIAQTRAVWLPRRRLAGAPVPEPRRVRRAALDLVGAAAVAGVAFGWLWIMADRLASLAVAPLAGAVLVASFLASLAIAWAVLGAGDALSRHAALAEALHMTPAEKREDDRLAGADPRWRKRREQLAREDRARPRSGSARARALRDAVAGASVLVLGDDVAVAIAWDPVHRPVPVGTATGHGARATQLLALARRHAIPVHRDASLASVLAGAEGEVAETHWPRLAEIIAATRARQERYSSTSTSNPP